jgi:plasmid replication initiation protein
LSDERRAMLLDLLQELPKINQKRLSVMCEMTEIDDFIVEKNLLVSKECIALLFERSENYKYNQLKAD